MFEDLIDSFDTTKWKVIPEDQKNAGKFKQYHVLRNHEHMSDTVVKLGVAEEEGDLKPVLIKDLIAQKDPLKDIGQVELQLNEEENEIIGIDLNGEIVVKQ